MKMKLHAFTLVEIALVLLITSCVFLVSVGPGMHTLAALKEKVFFNELRQTWFALIYQGEQQRRYTWVQFEKKQVKFNVGPKTLKVLDYPETLTPAPEWQELDISALGSLSPTTESFTSSLGKEYKVHFQLGYGTQYRVEESDKSR